MCSAGTQSAGSAGRCKLGAEHLGPDVAHESVTTRIAPGPAKRIVEQAKRIVQLQFRQLFRIVGGRTAKPRVRDDRLPDRRGVMGGDDPPCEGDVGQVRTIGVDLRIGRVRPS
jgi:hypothetical protein